MTGGSDAALVQMAQVRADLSALQGQVTSNWVKITARFHQVTAQLEASGTATAELAGRCEGSWTEPADDIALASWLPLVPGLTPHGLRHGHQTWMDEAGVPDASRQSAWDMSFLVCAASTVMSAQTCVLA